MSFSSTMFIRLIFLPLLFLPNPIICFDAIPFLQIDHHFYLRLAQCQAKCAEKYSSASPSNSLDGAESTTSSSATSLLALCHQGCLDSDLPASPHRQSSSLAAENPQAQAFSQGRLFFRQSLGHHHHRMHLQNQKLPKSSAAGGDFQVRPLCAQRMSPAMESPQEKFEATLIVEERKNMGKGKEMEKEEAKKARTFVISWRRKSSQNGEEEEAEEKDEMPPNGAKMEEGQIAMEEEGDKEPQWITASIESSPRFHVSSLPPGFLHQFRVQPVSVSGPHGPPAISNWLDFAELANPNGIQRAQLRFFSQYNAEHGVAAWVRWTRKVEEEREEKAHEKPKPMLNIRLRRHFSPYPSFLQPEALTAEGNGANVMPSHPAMAMARAAEREEQQPVVFPTCRLQIEWANKSTRTVEQFQLDGSDGFLLRHLAFNSEYSVRLLPIASSSSASSGLLLEGKFLSMQCSQVFGPGSLECEPEPVVGLSVVGFPSNGSALISWEVPVPVDNILLYELAIEPIPLDPANLEECQVRPSARIISAQSSSAMVSLPILAVCNFEIRLSLYDLLGRDAPASIRFQFVPVGLSSPDSSTGLSLNQFLSNFDVSLLALLFVLVMIPIAAIVALICTFSRGGARIRRRTEIKKTKKDSNKKKDEKKKKLKEIGNENEEKMKGKLATKEEEAEATEKCQWDEDKMPMKQQLDQDPQQKNMPSNSHGSSACNSPQSSTGMSATGTEITTLPRREETAMASATTTTDEEEMGGGGGEGQQQEERKTPNLNKIGARRSRFGGGGGMMMTKGPWTFMQNANGVVDTGRRIII